MLVTLLPAAPNELVKEVFVVVDDISAGTKPFRLREIFTFTNSTFRLSESFRPVSSDIELVLSSAPSS